MNKANHEVTYSETTEFGGHEVRVYAKKQTDGRHFITLDMDAGKLTVQLLTGNASELLGLQKIVNEAVESMEIKGGNDDQDNTIDN